MAAPAVGPNKTELCSQVLQLQRTVCEQRLERAQQAVKPGNVATLRTVLKSIVKVVECHYMRNFPDGFVEYLAVVDAMTAQELETLTVPDLRARVVRSQDMGRFVKDSWRAALRAYRNSAGRREQRQRKRAEKAERRQRKASAAPPATAGVAALDASAVGPPAAAPAQATYEFTFEDKTVLLHALSNLPAAMHDRALRILKPACHASDDEQYELDLDAVDQHTLLHLYEYCLGMSPAAMRDEPGESLDKPRRSTKRAAGAAQTVATTTGGATARGADGGAGGGSPGCKSARAFSMPTFPGIASNDADTER